MGQRAAGLGWLGILVVPACSSFSVEGEVDGEVPSFAHLVYAETDAGDERRLEVVAGPLGCEALGAYLDDLADADDADEAEELWDSTFEGDVWQASLVLVGELDAALDLDLDLDDRPLGDDEARFVLHRLDGYDSVDVDAVATDGSATLSRSEAEGALAVTLEAELEDAADGDALGELTITGTATWCEALADALESGGPGDTDGGGDDTDGGGDDTDGGGDDTDGGGDDTDAETDTDAVDTDGAGGTTDTGGAGSLFELTGYEYTAQVGIDAFGRASVFGFDGGLYTSALFITLIDDEGTADDRDDQTCSFAFRPVTQEGFLADTASPLSFPVQDQAYASWRNREGLLGAFGLWEGNYEVTEILDDITGDPCPFAPDWEFFPAEAEAFFLADENGVPRPLLIGLGDTLSADLEAVIRGSSLSSADRAAALANWSSSYLRLPVEFTLPGGSATRNLEAITQAYEVDDDMEAVFDRGGDLVPIESASFDAGGGRAAAGIYFLTGRISFSVTP